MNSLDVFVTTTHPFNISSESTLSSSFFTKTHITDKNILSSEKTPVRQTARGAIKESKKVNFF